jgi:hypothetical protein
MVADSAAQGSVAPLGGVPGSGVSAMVGSTLFGERGA